MSFADHFSGHASQYSRFRPAYPAALFDRLAALCERRERAWDVAAGSGQATRELDVRFDLVVASDGSRAQLGRLEPGPATRRLASLAEASGLASGSLDLVCAAQAIHWFDRSAFFREVERVLRPGGVLAAFCYELFTLDDATVAAELDAFHSDVGRHWPARRKMVENGYADLDMPWAPVASETFEMVMGWGIEDLLGYLGTWSATRRCAEAEERDPVAELRPRLSRKWGDPARERRVAWSVALKWARKPR